VPIVFDEASTRTAIPPEKATTVGVYLTGVVDTEYESERGHDLLYRPGSSVNGISLSEVQKWRGAIFRL